jgi:hypothetical protein
MPERVVSSSRLVSLVVLELILIRTAVVFQLVSIRTVTVFELVCCGELQWPCYSILHVKPMANGQ